MTRDVTTVLAVLAVARQSIAKGPRGFPGGLLPIGAWSKTAVTHSYRDSGEAVGRTVRQPHATVSRVRTMAKK